MRPLSEYLTICQAAKRLGVSVPTLRNWTTANKIQSYRNPANGYRPFLPEDITRLLSRVQHPQALPRS